MIGSREGTCAHGWPLVAVPVPARAGWVELRATPFDAESGKGCRLCPKGALLTVGPEPAPRLDVDAVLGPLPAP